MDREKIKSIISALPEEPGTYIMKDNRSLPIYIGKASSIKKRVSSYFNKRKSDIKTRMLVKNIEDIEFIVTDTEIEALILENNLIKKHKPKFNIRLKDDKKFPYIAISINEKFPRIIFTRELVRDGKRYFGPYTDAKAARNIVSMISNTFRIRTCGNKIPFKKGERPCINYQMKRCSAPCTETIKNKEYWFLVKNAIRFLEGNIDPLLEDLEKLMNKYSQKMEYEEAARIRDIIFDIQKISISQKVDVPIGMDNDYIGIVINRGEAVLVLFEFRKGVLLGRKISIFENVEYTEPEDIIRSFIVEHYANNEVPQKIITQYKISDRDIIESYLTEKSARKTSILLPLSSEDKSVMNMIRKNIDIISAERAAHNNNSTAEGLEKLQNILKLNDFPEIIECFDISNIQGKQAVASMVSFKNGKPDKDNYRRYRIRAYSSANDPGMIHEVVSRRLQYLINEDKELPGLIVIDGGKPQLSRALEAASNFNLNINIISIAKKFEEIFFDLKTPPMKLPPSSPALKIIRRIRDEAHRFALAYHKKIRGKEMIGSVIDNIPNIGEKSRISLIKHFKSVKNISNAQIDELKEAEGIGEKSARIIFNFFHRRD